MLHYAKHRHYSRQDSITYHTYENLSIIYNGRDNPPILSRWPGLRMLSVYLLCLLVLLAAAAQAARQLAGGGAGRVAGRARLLLLGETHTVKREVHVHKLPVLGQTTLIIRQL